MITAQSLDTPAHGLAFTQPSLAPSPHEPVSYTHLTLPTTPYV